MKVTDTSVVGVATRIGQNQVNHAKPARESADQAKSGPETVNKPDAVSVTSPVSDTAGRTAEVTSRPDVVNAGGPETSRNMNTEVRRDYSVDDGGDVVVKIIDQQKDEVVREIPAKEQRRIKQAIEEIGRRSIATAGAHESARRADIPGSANNPGSGNLIVDLTT